VWQGLFSHTFLPARGNVLLVGDAFGIRLPVSGEGIGTALKSGLLAANSIVSAIESGVPPDGHYLDGIEPILTELRKMVPQFKKSMMRRKAEELRYPWS
jgi:flavin-dependent dehydrogenase